MNKYENQKCGEHGGVSENEGVDNETEFEVNEREAERSNPN